MKLIDVDYNDIDYKDGSNDNQCYILIFLVIVLAVSSIIT